MKVYGLDIADDKGLTNMNLYRYAQELKISDFRGVFMCDTLSGNGKSKGMRYCKF